MAHDGIIATDFHMGSVDGEAFADFVRGSLIPQMQAFDGESERSIAVMATVLFTTQKLSQICLERQE